MKVFKTLVFGLSILLTFPSMVLAHGSDEVGRVEVGAHLIIVDSIIKTLTSGAAQRLNVEVEKKDATSTEAKRVDYSEVWIRITGPNDEFLFSGNIHRTDIGFVTGFTYFFANPGDYELTMRFLNSGVVVAEGSIAVPVAPGVGVTQGQIKDSGNLDLISIMVGSIAGLFIGSVIMWRMGRRS